MEFSRVRESAVAAGGPFEAVEGRSVFWEHLDAALNLASILGPRLVPRWRRQATVNDANRMHVDGYAAAIESSRNKPFRSPCGPTGCGRLVDVALPNGPTVARTRTGF